MKQPRSTNKGNFPFYYLFDKHFLQLLCVSLFLSYCVNIIPRAKNNIMFTWLTTSLVLCVACTLIQTQKWTSPVASSGKCARCFRAQTELWLEIIEHLSLRKKKAECWSLGFTHMSSLSDFWCCGGLGNCSQFHCFYYQKA